MRQLIARAMMPVRRSHNFAGVLGSYRGSAFKSSRTGLARADFTIQRAGKVAISEPYDVGLKVCLPCYPTITGLLDNKVPILRVSFWLHGNRRRHRLLSVPAILGQDNFSIALDVLGRLEHAPIHAPQTLNGRKTETFKFQTVG